MVRPPMYSELDVVVLVLVVVVARGVGRAFLRAAALLKDDLISLLLSVVSRFLLLVLLLVAGRLRDRDGFRGRLGAAMSLAPTLSWGKDGMFSKLSKICRTFFSDKFTLLLLLYMLGS